MRAPPLIITQQNPQNYFGKLRLKVEHVVQLDEEIPIASAEEEDRLFHQIPVGSEVARVAAGRLLFAQVVPFLFQERLSFVKLKKKKRNPMESLKQVVVLSSALACRTYCDALRSSWVT